MSKMKTRREFLKNSLFAVGAACACKPEIHFAATTRLPSLKDIHIVNVDADFEREPLIRPFGFKGGALSELWQVASYLESDSGQHGIGLSTQSVLWSDAKIFSSHSESGGNSLMYTLTEKAIQLLRGRSFRTPIDLLDAIYPEVLAYGQTITSNPDLRKTFVLNALVGIDNAAWLLYARENGFTTFDEMIPAIYKDTFSSRHDKIASIPLIPYNIPLQEVEATADQGHFFMKIKIGQAGSQAEMLEKDKMRIREIHQTIGHKRNPYTKEGRVVYYLDANGRYEQKDTFLKLLDYTKKIGAYDRIAIIEEPFPEEMECDVTDIPVRLVADETAHTDQDALKRIQMGYRAIALKPIAKTLSMTMKIAKLAQEHQVPCFCADLTVNPILVEWNKNVAARLQPFPGLGNLSLLESNGSLNYLQWDKMMDYHPQKSKQWVNPISGLYHVDDDFYKTSGGIFDSIPHYETLFAGKKKIMSK